MHEGHDGNAPAERDPQRFWEARYAGADRVWSGRPNQVLVDEASALDVGTALDLGCGEGGDSIWLAQRGWRVTAVDISTTAIARGADAAAAMGAEGVSWVATDLATWTSDARFDLVSACFLQSPVALPTADILAHAAGLVSPGGRLLIVAHAQPPPWSSHRNDEPFPTAHEQLAALDLPAGQWEVLAAESRARRAIGPDGHESDLDDTVVLVRRR